MASQTDVQVECGFCVSKLEDLTDPRCLPCGHIYCLECLLGDFEVNKILKCPFCREVFDLEINSLPSSTTREDSALCCDTCIRKEEPNQLAVVYCKTCTAKFCAKHKESHDDLMGVHPMINMTEYKTQTIKLEPRLCSEHTTLPYSLGCRSCLIVACTKCVGALDNCTTDSPLHKLMSLDELVAELAKEMDKVRSDMMNREDKLSDVFKHMTGVLCDYDQETRNMIETLHRTRDEQIDSIQLKYENLEKELVKLREDVKLRLERFTEQHLGSSLADLHRHRLQIEARHKHNHQVDIINRHEETMKEMEKLLAAEFPALQVSNMASLQVKGKRRDIEVKVVTSFHKFTDIEKTIPDSSHEPDISVERRDSETEALLRSMGFAPGSLSGCTVIVDSLDFSKSGSEEFHEEKRGKGHYARGYGRGNDTRGRGRRRRSRGGQLERGGESEDLSDMASINEAIGVLNVDNEVFRLNSHRSRGGKRGGRGRKRGQAQKH